MALSGSQLRARRVPRGFGRVRFSVPAYLCAALAGGETLSLIFFAWSVLDGAPEPALLLAFLVGAVGALFMLPIMLPGTLLAVFIINRWQLDGLPYYGALGALVVAGTGGLLLLPLSLSLPWEHALTGLPLVSALLLGGIVAGVTYRWILDREDGTR